jgi:tRNA pseudouridine55 synthase
MNGIIVIDKPSDMTSARVVAHVKKALRAKKAGHTGTLDPFATGVLVCCINKATRLAQFLTCGKKRYKGVMRLGIRTDTQDLTGRVISNEARLRITDQDVRRAFRTFLDIKYQNPPAYSALKQGGVRLYELARQGTFVRKPARRIHIYELEVTDISLPDVRFDVACGEGTYIRTLCADIGDALGCGAHLRELCRTESGHFTLAEAISLEALERLSTMEKISDYVVPMSVALRGIPGLLVDNELAEKIRHGQPVTQEELPSLEEGACPWIKVTDVRGNLVAVISSQEEKGIYSYACVFPGPHS